MASKSFIYSSEHGKHLHCCRLFDAVTLTKNADIDNASTGYVIRFDRRSIFSFPGVGFGKNVLIFGVDISSSSLSGVNSYLFVNGSEIYKFKAKDSEIVSTPLCLGNISKDWSTDNMKKTGFRGYVYDFSVDSDVIDVDDIRDIHNYLVKKNNII